MRRYGQEEERRESFIVRQVALKLSGAHDASALNIAPHIKHDLQIYRSLGICAARGDQSGNVQMDWTYDWKLFEKEEEDTPPLHPADECSSYFK
jgi:hypothetical protein